MIRFVPVAPCVLIFFYFISQSFTWLDVPSGWSSVDCLDGALVGGPYSDDQTVQLNLATWTAVAVATTIVAKMTAGLLTCSSLKHMT
jgi:hypothetical protein